MRRQLAWVVATAAIVASAALAQAQTYTVGLGNGTMQYTVSIQTSQCDAAPGYPPDIQNVTQYDYSNFIYTDQNGFQYSLPFGGVYFDSPGTFQCPASGPGSPTMTGGGYGFQITWTPADGGACGCSINGVPAGYIDPKYVIAAMIYAPPGPSSYVQYGGSAYTGNSSTISSSVEHSTQVNTKLSFGPGIFGWLNGLLDSSTYSRTTSASSTYGNSSTVTTSVTFAGFQQFPGTPVPWTGWWASGFNPHDYDQAELWLNPTLPMDEPNSSTIDWYGYGYDECDQGAGTLDFYPVQLGKIDPQTHWQMTPSDVQALGRAWTTSGANCEPEVFASGTPALTAADYSQIIAADPVFQQSLSSTHPARPQRAPMAGTPSPVGYSLTARRSARTFPFPRRRAEPSRT